MISNLFQLLNKFSITRHILFGSNLDHWGKKLYGDKTYKADIEFQPEEQDIHWKQHPSNLTLNL